MRVRPGGAKGGQGDGMLLRSVDAFVGAIQGWIVGIFFVDPALAAGWTEAGVIVVFLLACCLKTLLEKKYRGNAR